MRQYRGYLGVMLLCIGFIPNAYAVDLRDCYHGYPNFMLDRDGDNNDAFSLHGEVYCDMDEVDPYEQVWEESLNQYAVTYPSNKREIEKGSDPNQDLSTGDDNPGKYPDLNIDR